MPKRCEILFQTRLYSEKTSVLPYRFLVDLLLYGPFRNPNEKTPGENKTAGFSQVRTFTKSHIKKSLTYDDNFSLTYDYLLGSLFHVHNVSTENATEQLKKGRKQENLTDQEKRTNHWNFAAPLNV